MLIGLACDELVRCQLLVVSRLSALVSGTYYLLTITLISLHPSFFCPLSFYMWSVYLIRCGDRSLYTGISNDVPKRFKIHQSGKAPAAKYTRTRHPLKLVFTQEIGDRSLASKVEYKVKQLPKRKKELLVAGLTSLTELGIL